MKVVLAKPPIPRESVMILTLPIGLGYIGSYLKKNIPDTKVIVIDSDVQGYHSVDKFVKRIKDEKPDVLGITVFSHMVLITKEVLKRIKAELGKDICLVVGGPHVNAVREKVFRDMPSADFGIISDGELGLTALVECLNNGSLQEEMSRIPGLLYRHNGAACVNPNIFNPNIDGYDFIDYKNIVNVNDYLKGGSPMGLFHLRAPVATIITTRGCPFPCRFCASALNTGKKVRSRSSMHVVAEIKDLVVNYGAREIHIMDDNFTFSKQHVRDICQGITNENLDISIAMPNGIRLDTVDEEMLFIMKKVGFYSLGFGIETASADTLKYISKGITRELIKEKVALAKKAGFQTVGFFILGFPNETVQDNYNTGRFPDEIGLDFASFGNFTPLPGTSLYNELVKKKEIKDDFLPSFSSGEITYSPKGITPKELKQIQERVILFYYLNPRRLYKIISLLKLKDVKYAFRRLFLILFRPKIRER